MALLCGSLPESDPGSTCFGRAMLQRAACRDWISEGFSFVKDKRYYYSNSHFLAEKNGLKPESFIPQKIHLFFFNDLKYLT
jgi:hypothetical protein